MADLSFLHDSGTVAAIDRHHEEAYQHRGRLGLSQAGHPCKRWLWYTHKGYAAAMPDGRVLRLFRLGDAIERLVIGDLAAAGCLVYHAQQEVEFIQDGVRLLGHIDGKVIGLKESPNTAHLFECKSANKKKFEELCKLADYARWNEIYGFQVQFYMLGLGLKRAAVFVYCKDDSRLYMERIRLDRDAAIEKLQAVFEAITSPIEPERRCPRADYFQAKWCGHYQRCWGP